VWLHHVGVGSMTDVLEMHATSNFGIEVCRVGEFLCLCRSVLRKHHRKMGENTGGIALSRPMETDLIGRDGAPTNLAPCFFHSINIIYTEIHLPFTLKF
jgi:hypothetical protein